MPLAIFILVALSALALSLQRGSSQAPLTVSQEIISQQTMLAAQSGAEYSLSYLFYTANPDGGLISDRCSELDSQTLSLNYINFNNCVVIVSCVEYTSDQDYFFNIESQASCGSYPFDAQRTIKVGARAGSDL